LRLLVLLLLRLPTEAQQYCQLSCDLTSSQGSNAITGQHSEMRQFDVTGPFCIPPCPDLHLLLPGQINSTDNTGYVHKVSFPLVPQLANLILREATAHT
jgi:hypothetical protein